MMKKKCMKKALACLIAVAMVCTLLVAHIIDILCRNKEKYPLQFA